MRATSPTPINLNEPVKKGDFLQLQRELNEMRELMNTVVDATRAKKFYTIAEFHKLVGPSEAVIQKYCTIGKLKATQVVKGGTWIIDAREIERMRREAIENHYNKTKSTTSTDKAILKKLGIKVARDAGR